MPKEGAKKRTRITPELAERVVGALQVGADMALAAGLIGVTREGLRLYAQRHAGLQERFDEARARADDVIVKTLYDQAKAGNTTAIIFWLKNRRSAEWRDRRELAGVPDAPLLPGPIRVVFDDALDEDEDEAKARDERERNDD